MSNLTSDTKAAVANLFDVEITDAWPIHGGDYSQVFRVHDAADKAYILKVHEKYSKEGAAVIAYLQSINFKWMPKQYLSKKGNVWEQCDDGYMSLQEFIDSPQTLLWNSTVDDDYYKQLGVALYDLHHLEIPEALAEQLERETYEPRHLQDWRAVAQKAQAGGDTITDQFKIAIADNQSKITEIIDRAIALGKTVKEQNRKLCLIHGDFHLANVIKPASGDIYVIDWDFPMLSLPEHDMMIFINPERVKKITAGYNDPAFPEPHAHAYYSLGKILRGLWFYVNRGIDTKYSEPQRKEYLQTFRGMLLDNSDADQSLNFARSLDKPEASR